MATTDTVKKLIDGADPKTLTENQAKSALGSMVEKLTKTDDRAKKVAGQVAAAGGALLTTAEIQGTNVALSAVQGWRGGAAKMRVGGKLHVGALIGVPLAITGIVRAAMGKHDATHLIAIGNGAMAPAVTAAGEEIGQMLKEKWSKDAAKPAAAAATPPAETNAAGQKLQRDAAGNPVMDATGQPVYAGFQDVSWRRPRAQIPEAPPARLTPPARPYGRLARARTLAEAEAG